MKEMMNEFVGITNPFNFTEIIVKGQKKFIVSGYISTMDVDLVGDQITSECLQDMLHQIQSGSVKMDWEHETIIEQDLNKVPRAKILPETAKVDGKGLWVEAEINPNHTEFKEIWGSIKNKFLDAFSIAFRPIEAVVKWVGDRAIRILNKIKLINVGITGNPINEEARMDKVIVKALTALGSGLSNAPEQEDEEDEDKEEEKEPVEKKALTYEGQNVYAGNKSNMDMVAGKFCKTYDLEKDLILEGMQEEMIQLDAVNNDMDTIATMACKRLKADPEHYKKLKAIENRESYSTGEMAEESNEKSEVTEVTYPEDKGTMENDKKQKPEEKQDKEDYKSELASIKSDVADLKAAIESLKAKKAEDEKKQEEEAKAEDNDKKQEAEKKSVLSEIKSLKEEVEFLKSLPVMKSQVSEVPTKLNEKELPSVIGLIR